MAPGLIVFWITLGAVVLTVLITAGLRISGGIAHRRVERYEELVRPWLAQYAVGAREDLPPTPRRRFQKRAVLGILRGLIPQLKGEASGRLVRAFAQYGLVEAARLELDSRSGLTRLRASDMLGLMRVSEAAPWLRAHLRDEDLLLRLSCARALADLGEIDSLPEILAALGAENEHELEATAILFGFGPAAIPFLRHHLTDAPAQERRLSAAALGELRALEAVPELRDALDAADDELAAAAARALGRIGDTSVAGTLVEVLHSERTWFVKVACAHALGHQEAAGAAPALVESLSAPRWDLRNAAASALRSLDEAGLRLVMARLDEIPDPGLAHFAGLLDMEDRLDAVITRAAAGESAAERFVRRACSAGVHARLDQHAAEGGPLAGFAERVLESNRPADAMPLA